MICNSTPIIFLAKINQLVLLKNLFREVTIPESVKNLLKHDKSIQIVSKDALREWCKITPIIPSRRGAIAIIRQGDNNGNNSGKPRNTKPTDNTYTKVQSTQRC